MKKTIILTSFLTVFTILTHAQDQSLQEVRKVIEASNANFADMVNKNDGSIRAKYTDDACLYPPNAAPVKGKDNIVNFFKSGPKVHCTFTIQHLYGDPNTYVTEESNYVLTDFNGKELDNGRVIVIWKKTKDGWKMYRDMFSSNLPHK